MDVKFFKTYITGKEIVYLRDIIDNRLVISGDGIYTKKVQELLQNRYHANNVLLTTSGTTALEMAVRLLRLNPGDEVIAPSFTFSSTINAILLSGIKVQFAEIQKDTLNIDPYDIQRKLNKRTKAIVVVHYAGVSCDMGAIMRLSHKYRLKVIEDAAQAIDATYKNTYLGTIGDFGCLSFHETKNITCGEGGAIFINTKSSKAIETAEIIREKGTNRSKFFRGHVDRYTWVDIGSSYLPSDFLAAVLLAQLEEIDKINRLRKQVYQFYRDELHSLEENGIITLPTIPEYAGHNAHIFYTLFPTPKERDFMLNYLNHQGIRATFHYIPLHSSPQGRKLGYRKGDFPITERVSATLIRLPIWAGMKKDESHHVITIFKAGIEAFARNSRRLPKT